MAKLKEALGLKKLFAEESPNIGSQQGSCSKGGVANLELELVAARKKLDLDGDQGSAEEKDAEKDEFVEKDVAEEKNGVEEIQREENGEVKGSEVLEVVDNPMDDAALINQRPSTWELFIETPTNVVAHATVDMVSTVLHGKPIGEDNARVSITHVIQGAAHIPFPIEDEITTVEQAVGTFIAWPRNLLREVNAASDDMVKPRTVKGGKKNGIKKMKKVNELVSEPDSVVNMGPDFPPTNLKKLWLWASATLKDGRSHPFQLSKEAFGSTDKKCLFKSDFKALCFGGEISGGVICMFINVLQDHLRKHKMTDMITFVNPSKIGAIGCGTPAARSRALSLRFKDAKPGQVFLLPYHHTNHWALTVVPNAQLVYHMDPLKRRIANEEWIEVVNNGIKIYKEEKIILKKKINWENLAGVPAQTGTTDCGLFLMHYMKEICLDKELKFATKWARRTNVVCDADDLNEIKCTWANVKHGLEKLAATSIENIVHGGSGSTHKEPAVGDVNLKAGDVESKISITLAPCESSSSNQDSEVKVNVGPNRCCSCRKRVGLTGFSCRCGNLYCADHRYPEKHECSFDYRAAEKDAIRKANPVVKREKLDKI
ncbi:hypothetical protein ACET3Z_019213 [Daucus carota]